MKTNHRQIFVCLSGLIATILLQGCGKPCPDNYHWSDKDKMCVPSYTRTGPRG